MYCRCQGRQVNICERRETSDRILCAIRMLHLSVWSVPRGEVISMWLVERGWLTVPWLVNRPVHTCDVYSFTFPCNQFSFPPIPKFMTMLIPVPWACWSHSPIPIPTHMERHITNRQFTWKTKSEERNCNARDADLTADSVPHTRVIVTV